MPITAAPPRPEPANAQRPRGRVAWLIIAVIATVVGLGSAASAAWSGLIDRNTQTQQQTYQRAAERIELDIGSGDVRVVRGGDGLVDVERRLEWSLRAPTVDERWHGDTLRITADCPSGLFNFFCSVDYVVQAPAGVAVETRTSAGDVAVEQIHGDLDITSSAGNIEVAGARGRVSVGTDAGNITVTGGGTALTARTSAGAITASGVTSTTNEVSTDAGHVDLRFAVAPERVLARSSAGDIVVVVPRDQAAAYRVQADTSAGSQNVTVDQDSSSTRTIDVDTSAGDIDVRYP